MKSHYKLIVCTLLSVLLFGQGCYTLNHVGTPTDTPIEITNAQDATPVEHFEQKKTMHHFVNGLVSPDDAGVEKLVSDAVKQYGGTRAVNVKIKYQQTFMNGLVGFATLGIYIPYTLTVEGDVVK